MKEELTNGNAFNTIIFCIVWFNKFKSSMDRNMIFLRIAQFRFSNVVLRNQP